MCVCAPYAIPLSRSYLDITQTSSTLLCPSFDHCRDLSPNLNTSNTKYNQPLTIWAGSGNPEITRVYFSHFQAFTLILRSEMKSTLKLFGVPSEPFVAFFISLRRYYEEPSKTPKGYLLQMVRDLNNRSRHTEEPLTLFCKSRSIKESADTFF